MLTDRQKEILKIICNTYIKTSIPVSSNVIYDSMKQKVSSATIRNDAATLEDLGYLEKMHSSSGRVPSTKGYRYYVDNIMDHDNIETIKAMIEKIFENRLKNTDEILEECSKILSEMTKLATIKTTNIDLKTVRLAKINLTNLSQTTFSVIYVLSNGEVKNKVFQLKEQDQKDIELAISILNDRLVNTPIEEITEKLDLVVPILKKQIKQCEQVLEMLFSGLFTNEYSKKDTKGIKYLLENPEFSNPEKIKEVLSFIENLSPLQLFDNQSQKAKILIGDETGIDDDISIISKKYQDNGKSTCLTLVGPKRLQYDIVEEVLELISKKLNEKSRGGRDG